MKNKQVSAAQFLMGFISTEQGQISQAIKGTAFSDEIRSQQQALLNDGSLPTSSALAGADLPDLGGPNRHPMALSRSPQAGVVATMNPIHDSTTVSSFRLDSTDKARTVSSIGVKTAKDDVKVDQVLLDRILAQFGVSAATRKKMLDAEDQQHRIALSRVKDILGSDSGVNLEILAHGQVAGREVRELFQQMQSGPAFSAKKKAGDAPIRNLAIADNRGIDLKRFESLLNRIVRDAEQRMEGDVAKNGGHAKAFTPLSASAMNEVATQLVEWVLPHIGNESTASRTPQAGAEAREYVQLQPAGDTINPVTGKGQVAAQERPNHRVVFEAAGDTVQWLIEPADQKAGGKQAVLVQMGWCRSRDDRSPAPPAAFRTEGKTAPRPESGPAADGVAEAPAKEADAPVQPLPRTDGETPSEELSPRLFKDVTVIRLSHDREAFQGSGDNPGRGAENSGDDARWLGPERQGSRPRPEFMESQRQNEKGDQRAAAAETGTYRKAAEGPEYPANRLAFGAREETAASVDGRGNAGADDAQGMTARPEVGRRMAVSGTGEQAPRDGVVSVEEKSARPDPGAPLEPLEPVDDRAQPSNRLAFGAREETAAGVESPGQIRANDPDGMERRVKSVDPRVASEAEAKPAGESARAAKSDHRDWRQAAGSRQDGADNGSEQPNFRVEPASREPIETAWRATKVSDGLRHQVIGNENGTTGTGADTVADRAPGDSLSESRFSADGRQVADASRYEEHRPVAGGNRDALSAMKRTAGEPGDGPVRMATTNPPLTADVQASPAPGTRPHEPIPGEVRGSGSGNTGTVAERMATAAADRVADDAAAGLEQRKLDGDGVPAEGRSHRSHHRTGSHRSVTNRREPVAVSQPAEKSGAQTQNQDSNPGGTAFRQGEPDSELKMTDPKPAEGFNRFAAAPLGGPDAAKGTMPMETLSFQSPDWSNQLVDHFKGMRQRNLRQLVIQLHPEKLGSMVLRLKSEKGRIITRITADNEAAKQLLLQNASQLQQQMADQGFVLGEFSVDIGQMAQQGFRRQDEGNFRAPRVNTRRTGLGRQQGMGTSGRVLVYPQRSRELKVNLIA